MRSITTSDLQYVHKFYGFRGEAQYLHEHTGILTLEVEGTVSAGANMVFPYDEIQKTAWEILKSFDHTTTLREDDPLLPALLGAYEAQGIKDGTPNNIMKGPALRAGLVTTYPGYRLVVTEEIMTVEGTTKIACDLLRDKLNIVKVTLTSGVNAASEEFKPQRTMERCPLCGVALDENDIYPKCGYRK